jgi:HSP20 family protein
MNFIKYRQPDYAAWSPLSNLRDQFTQFFDLAYPGEKQAFDWSPALDVSEDKEKYLVAVELPGLKKEDLQVVVHDGVLTVSGERKSEKEVQDGTVHRSERSYGKFSRSITLPSAVSADRVGASFKDGVLSIEIPKVEEAKPKNIEVKVS